MCTHLRVDGEVEAGGPLAGVLEEGPPLQEAWAAVACLEAALAERCHSLLLRPCHAPVGVQSHLLLFDPLKQTPALHFP